MKYITYDNKANSYTVYIPRTQAKELNRKRVVGKRVKLEEALALREEWFSKLGIMGLIEPTTNTDDSASEAPTFEENGAVASATCKGSKVTTVDELLDRCEVDRDVWEVEREVVNCWDVTNKNGQTFQNFQIKAWLKRKFAEIDVEVLRKRLSSIPKAKKIKKKRIKGDHLLEINIADLHFGRLCWHGETGEDFDMKIARERFLTALNRLISLSHAFDIEKVLFIMGNDFFQADNLIGETTSGTRQDMDGRYGKMYSEGVALVIEAIEILRRIAPVEVVSVVGNHEKQSGMCAAHCVSLYYDQASDVSVDWQPIPRKYRRYHDNMIALAHGDKIKKNEWFEIIASESASMWGETKHRYLHLGHFHHNRTEEHRGLTIQYLGSLTGSDNWHSESGYVQTRKSASAFVYSKNNGIASELICNLNVDVKVNAENL